MTGVKDFECVGTRAYYRPVAQVTFEQALDLMAVALKKARELGLVDIVVNTFGLTGIQQPTVFGRYSLATKVVECAGSSLRVAFVSPQDLIDPQKIGRLMMQNRGVDVDVFPNEPEALAWLDARLRRTNANREQ